MQQRSNNSLSTKALNPATLLEAFFIVVVLFVGSGAIFPLLRRPYGEGTVIVGVGAPEGRIYEIAFVITVVLLVRNWRELLDCVRAEPVLWLLPLLALTSVLWSTDRGETLRGAVLLIGSMLFGSYLALRFDGERQVAVVGAMLTVVVVLSVATIALYPSFGIEVGTHNGNWRGVYSHKNLFGRVMMLSTAVFVALVWYRPNWRGPAILLAIVSVLCIAESHSKTAALGATVLLLFLLTRGVFRRLKVPTWAVAVALGAILAGLGWLAWSQRQTLTNPDVGAETFTGRTVLWAASLLKLSERPVLGYGYLAFWGGRAGAYVDVWRIVAWAPPNSHNAFLDVALDLGLVGLALFAWAFAKTFARSLELFRRDGLSPLEQLWPSLVITFTLLSYLTEGQLLENHTYWMMFTAVAVTTTRSLRSTIPVAERAGAPSAQVQPTLAVDHA